MLASVLEVLSFIPRSKNSKSCFFQTRGIVCCCYEGFKAHRNASPSCPPLSPSTGCPCPFSLSVPLATALVQAFIISPQEYYTGLLTALLASHRLIPQSIHLLNRCFDQTSLFSSKAIRIKAAPKAEFFRQPSLPQTSVCSSSAASGPLPAILGTPAPGPPSFRTLLFLHSEMASPCASSSPATIPQSLAQMSLCHSPSLSPGTVNSPFLALLFLFSPLSSLFFLLPSGSPLL